MLVKRITVKLLFLKACLFGMTTLYLPTVAGSEHNVQFADKIIVNKSERKMFLISNGRSFRTYSIGLGDAPEGHKQQRGDEKTPEGVYTIDYRNPNSHYHLSLHINYPNAHDKKIARNNRINPGGDIFIHGLPNNMALMSSLFKGKDWTDGCIAVTNDEIEEIWHLVKNGTPIEILP